VAAATRKAPSPGGALGAFLATLGKPRTAAQFPITESDDGGERIVLKVKADAPPEMAALAASLRARIPELIAASGMPHAIASARAEHSMHPLKPPLEKHFK